MAEKKKYSLFSTILFGLIALVVSGLMLASYLSMVINPSKLWFATFFGILYIPLLILTVLMLLVALRRRSSMATWLLVVLLPAIWLTGRCLQLRAPEPEKGPLKVVSFNAGLFVHGQKGLEGASRLALADSAAAFLRGTGADIICLQEFGLPVGVGLSDFLSSRFPGYHPEYFVLTGDNGYAGNVTLSRLPVVRKGKLEFEGSTNMALYTDISLDTTVFRIYNCHFQSYNLSPDSVIRSIGHDEALTSTENKMKRAIKRRPDQVGAVLQSMEESPVHSMVVGDFNDTPVSYTYQRLKAGRKDSFVEAGKGFGATYVKFRPFIRIDYILYPKDFEICSYEVPQVPLSDHYPIIATYR